MDDFGIKVFNHKRKKEQPTPEPHIYKLDGEEITEWDLKFLYTRGERLNVEEIADLFDAQPETVIKYMWYYGITKRWEDKILDNKIRKAHKDAEDKQIKIKHHLEVKKRLGSTKEPEQVTINNKTYVDALEKAEYDEKYKNVEDQMYYETHDPDGWFINRWEGGVSKLTGIDLRALRAYRGLDRIAFANQAKVSPSMIRYYEMERHAIITKLVEGIYIDTLKLKPKEIKKIQDVLSGKRTLEEEEDREIPEYIRKQVWVQDKGKCSECRIDKHLHFHHIKKFSEGGMHTVDNLKLLCVACHAETHREDKSFYMLKKMALDMLGVEVS